MNEENEIAGLMYTVNSERSYFDNIKASLKIFLREQPEDNVYVFKAFDLSQKLDGTQYNVIFLCIKNENSDYEDPTATTLDNGYECNISNLIPLNTLANFSAFECQTKDNALIISLYEFTNDSELLQGYAEMLFPMIHNLYDQVIKNGNFQDNLAIAADGGKKITGVSRIPRY